MRIKDLRGLDDAYVTLENGKTATAVTLDADKSILYPPVNKWGHNDDIDTADASAGQIIWQIKATTQQYKFLFALATGLNIQSSSAADILTSGTGAWQVKIIYQDANGVEQTFIADLNGVTPVPLAFTTLGIFRMSIETTGSGNTNAGDITVTDSTGDTICIIKAGEGQTQIAVQRIPAGVKGICKYHKVYFPGGGPVASADMRLRVKKADGTVLTKWEPELTSNKVEDERRYDIGGIEIQSGEWLYWECINVGANDVKISATFDIEYFDLES